MISILFATALAGQSIANPVVVEFGRLCLSGQPSVTAIRDRARQYGWYRAGSSADLSKNSIRGRLTLKTSDQQSAAETREVCSISADSALKNTVPAAETLLGFKPAVDLDTSATFFAVRDRTGWQAGSGLNRTAFEQAKREGRFYSVIASVGDGRSMMTALHVLGVAAGASPRQTTTTSSATGAGDILHRLDLDSFPNSTGPRRQPTLHTPVDYGLTSFQSFDDGWTEASEPDDSWHMSALLLEGSSKSGTICFVDAGGKGATYRATQVLHVQTGADDRLTATQIADRPDCRNQPPFKAG